MTLKVPTTFALVVVLCLICPLSFASTGSFIGTVTSVNKGKQHDKSKGMTFGAKLNFFIYVSKGGAHLNGTKVGIKVPSSFASVNKWGTFTMLNGEPCSLETFIRAMEPGVWGSFYESTWHSIYTTPPYVSGEFQDYSKSKQQLAVKVHYADNARHVPDNPAQIEIFDIDPNARFLLEGKKSSAAQVFQKGHYLAIHPKRPMTLDLRSPASELQNKQLSDPRKSKVQRTPATVFSGRAYIPYDLSNSTMTFKQGGNDAFQWRMQGKQFKVHWYDRINNTFEAMNLRGNTTTANILLDGHVSRFDYALRPDRHKNIGVYRGQERFGWTENLQLIWVESGIDRSIGIIESLKGNKLTIKELNVKGEPSAEKVIEIPSNARIMLDGDRRASKKQIKKGLKVIVLHERPAQTIIAYRSAVPSKAKIANMDTLDWRQKNAGAAKPQRIRSQAYLEGKHGPEADIVEFTDIKYLKSFWQVSPGREAIWKGKRVRSMNDIKEK